MNKITVSLKSNKYDIMIVAGILFIAFGTFLMQMGNNGKSAAKTKELESQLQERDAKIEKQANIIHDSITGGDTFPFLMFKRTGSKNALQVVAYGVGNHILRNVEITIIDQGKRKEEAFRDLKDESINPGDHMLRSVKNLDEHLKVYKIGNLVPNKSMNFLKFGTHLTLLEPAPQDTVTLEIHISSSNGFFIQRFKSVPINENQRTMATQVWDQNENTVFSMAPEAWAEEKSSSKVWE